MNPMKTVKHIVWVALLVPACSNDGPERQAAQLGTQTPSVREGAILASKDGTAADNMPSAASIPRRSVVAPKAQQSIPADALVPDTLSGDVDCDNEQPAPTACAWAAEADFVALATIEDLRMDRDNPVARERSGWKRAASCRRAHAAMAIGLSVEKVLAGSGPQRFDLQVGARQLVRFRPMPHATATGIVWSPTKDPNVGPLRVGARVVVAAHKVGGAWSLMGDIILGVDGGDRIHVPPRTGDCLNTVPQGVAGAGVAALAEQLAGCGSVMYDVASKRRALRANAWGARMSPDHYASALCIDPPAGIAPRHDLDIER